MITRDTVTLTLFVTAVLIFFGFCFWNLFFEEHPCPQCGKKRVTKNTKYLGSGENDPSTSKMQDTFRCHYRKCRHVETHVWYAKPYAYCPTPYDWYKPPGHPYHVPDR